MQLQCLTRRVCDVSVVCGSHSVATASGGDYQICCAVDEQAEDCNTARCKGRRTCADNQCTLLHTLCTSLKVARVPFFTFELREQLHSFSTSWYFVPELVYMKHIIEVLCVLQANLVASYTLSLASSRPRTATKALSSTKKRSASHHQPVKQGN